MAMNVGSLFATLSLNSAAFTRGLGEASGAMSAFRERIGVVTRGVGSMAAVIGAVVGTTAVNAAKSFEEAMIPVGTLVGQDTQQFHELEHAIKELLKTTPTNADDLGISAYWILSAGIRDTAEATNVLTVSTKLSAAGLGTVEQSAKLVTSAMNAFKDQNLSAQQAAELLFGAVQTGKTTINDLAGGFGLIAPLADAAGLSMNDLLSAVTAMTNVGESASEAFSGMRGLLSNILQPTKEATETAKKLGIQFNIAHLQAVGFGQFMEEIRQKAGGNAEAITSLVGSIRGMNVAFGLTGGEAEKFQENLTGIAEAGALLDQRATEVNMTTSRQMTILRNRVNIALEEMGRKILGWWIPKLMEAADWVEANWPKIQETFHSVAEYIKGVLDSMFGPAIDRIKPKLEEFINWVRDHWPQISNIAGQVADFLADEVAPRIGTALGWLIDEGGKFADWFMQNVWPDVKHAAEVAWDWMSTDGVRLAKQAADGAVEAFNWMRRNVPIAWNDVRRATEISWNWMKDNVWPYLQPVLGAFQTAWDTIKAWTVTHWDEIKLFLSDVWTTIGGIAKVSWWALVTFWDLVGEQIKNQTHIVWDLIKGDLQAFWDIIRGAFHVFASLFRGDWDGMWDGIKTMLTGVWEFISTTIVNGLRFLKEDIVAGLHLIAAPWWETWNAMKDDVLKLWDDLKRDVQGKLDTLRDIIMTSLHWIRDQIWDPVVNGLKQGFVDAMQTMNDLAGPILDGLRGGFDFVRDGVQWLIDKVNELIGLIKGPLDAAKGILSGAAGIVGSVAGGASGAVHHLDPRGWAYGGISVGPASGYYAKLHGTEAILPLNDPKRTDQILRALGRSGGSSQPAPQITVVVVSSPEAAMAYLPREAKGQAQDAILKGRRY